MDLESHDRWVEYSQAKDTIFAHPNIPEAPRFAIEGVARFCFANHSSLTSSGGGCHPADIQACLTVTA